MHKNSDLALGNLSKALTRAFPHISADGRIRVLGEGFSSLVVETPDGMVFRVARTAQAGEKYAREVKALPVIKAYLPVAVPEPAAFLPGNADFPFGVIAYRKLAGTPLDPDRLSREGARVVAGQVGAILVALQRAPLHALGFRDDFDERRAGWVGRWQVVKPALREALAAEEYRKVADWWEDLLADESMRAYTAVAQHGDLWFGNLLVEGERVVGLLDFEEVGIGDPALDFVPQLYLGEQFLRWVEEAYRNVGGAAGGTEFEHRLRRLWGLREFGGLAYAIEQEDRNEFAESIEKIRKGPILSPLGLDGWQRYR